MFIYLYTPNNLGAQMVQDSSFEAGVPNAFWVEQSTNFSHVICNNSCGSNPGVEPRSGSNFVWLGGSAAQAEYGSIAQTINNVSIYSSKLKFYLKTPKIAPNSIDFFQVLIDSIVVFQITTADSSTYKYEYQEVKIDFNYAGGTSHNIMFKCFQSSILGVSHYLIDDVSIVLSVGVTEPKEISDFKIFPQPAHGYVNIQFEKSTSANLVLYSILGKKIMEAEIKNASQFQLDVSNLETGYYFVDLQLNDGIIRKKIIVIND